MKKIALFISSLQKGGSERVMVNLAEYLEKQGYEVLLVTQYKQDVEYEISKTIRRVYSEPSQEYLQGGRVHNFLQRFKTLRNIWKENKPDVILAFLGKNNLMAIATSRFLPSKVAVSVRGEPTMEYEGKVMQCIAKGVFCFADGIIMQTNDAKQFLPAWLHKKVRILPNPLNPAFVNKRYEGVREQEIVAVGRLDENKNHMMLIQAFEKIEKEFPDMKLTIYGEGNSRNTLEQYVKEKDLVSKVKLPGNIQNVAERIRKAKIFVLTSNTEGMPNSVMEAMALGMAVVSTDCPCGGPAMLIQNGINGMLVPVGDVNALANAFRKILSDDAYAKKLEECAYHIVEELHPDSVNKKWEEYLKSVASME